MPAFVQNQQLRPAYGNNYGNNGYNRGGYGRGVRPPRGQNRRQQGQGAAQPQGGRRGGRPAAGLPPYQGQPGPAQGQSVLPQNAQGQAGNAQNRPGGGQPQAGPAAGQAQQAGQQPQLSAGPLPDGVYYEPLDDRTRMFLQKRAGAPGSPEAGAVQAGGNVQAGQANVPNGPGAANPVEQEVADVFERRLGRMIQNERNASVYYGRLAAKSARGDHRNFLERVSAESLRRQTLFQDVFKGRNGADHVVAETEIYEAALFGEGVKYALDEEAGLLEDLIWLWENSADDRLRWAVQGQFNKKVGQINMLSLMANK